MRDSPAFAPHAAADAAVCAFLRGKSAHSDIAIPLGDAIRGLADARVFCSDTRNFGHVLAHVDGRVFCFAAGMHGIGVRLPPAAAAAAREEGAEPIRELGPEWWFLRLFDGPRLLSRTRHWVEAAYAHVRRRREPTP